MRSHVPVCLSIVCLIYLVASRAAAQEYYRSADSAPSPSLWVDVDSAASEASRPLAENSLFASTAALNSNANEASLNAASSCDCGPVTCDCAKLGKAVSGAYKGVFYDNNFSYLCDPCYQDWHPGESLKRRGIGEYVTVDFGGEYRLRFHNEHNIRGRALTGAGDEFVLQRLRPSTYLDSFMW